MAQQNVDALSLLFWFYWITNIFLYKHKTKSARSKGNEVEDSNTTKEAIHILYIFGCDYSLQ
jgi:hypothetical protein